jgi:uncharacterized protein YdaU (DUF1376 family)
MAALPYIQLYIADYLADTMHLQAEEHGAYLLLIFNYWQTGKPIPKNRLQSIARVSNERWTSVERSLNEYWNDTGTHWQHDRIDRDLELVKQAQDQRSQAGKASAQARMAKKPTEIQRPFNDRSTTVDVPLQRTVNETPTILDTDTDIENIILNTTAPAKAAASVDLVPTQPDPDKELYQSIQQAFLAKNGNKFTNYPKEAQGTKGIIAKCKARNPTDPAGMAQAMIEKLWQLKSGSDKFYSSQPFLPSTLNASGIWDRVLEQYRDHSEQEGKAKDLVSSFYRREE